jgi:hypothetical protein
VHPSKLFICDGKQPDLAIRRQKIGYPFIMDIGIFLTRTVPDITSIATLAGCHYIFHGALNLLEWLANPDIF